MDSNINIVTVKRRFFEMKNGVIADHLKNNGSPYPLVFGLNLPQLVDIADAIGFDKDLAVSLKNDSRTRESQLLASLIMPVDAISDVDDAVQWLMSMISTEAIDIACLKLIKKHPDSFEIVNRCLKIDSFLAEYAAVRLLWNIYTQKPNDCKEVLLKTKFNFPETGLMARNLLDEIEYILN